jgi:FkbM family methyltransferase
MLMTIEGIEYNFEGDTFVDVGGNIGFWTTKVFPYFNKILFIEPSELAMSQAKQNIENVGATEKVTYFKNLVSNVAGQFDKVTACSNDPGNFSIYAEKLYGTTNVKLSEDNIETMTIDSLIPLVEPGSKVFMKIDTEGCELDILLGSLEFIRTFKPVIIMEAHYHMYYDEEKEGKIIDFLNEERYSAIELKIPNYLNTPHIIYDGKHNGTEMYDLHYHMVLEPN